MSRTVIFMVLFQLIFILASCEKEEKEITRSSPESSAKPEITIGSKSPTEQRMLMKMTSLLLSENGFSVNEISFRGSLNIRAALEEGIIDQYWEYPNTARVFYHHHPPIYDSKLALQSVSKEDEKKGVKWLKSLDLNSTWAILIKSELAKQNRIKKISDFVQYANKHDIKLATNEEFLVRKDGLEHVQQIYHFAIDKKNIISVESMLLPQAVKDSRVDAAVGVAPDSHIKEYNLTILEDDKHVFPPYNPTPVVDKETLERYPKISKLLNRLVEKINEKNFMEMIDQVEMEHKDVSVVAQEFLIDTGLIKSK
ncbi:glycine betaine ABC transporter substrate-binding protein [Neobacillus niacini]|uniref:ABC transporter substrate-binding protein n=1 Tax=Neobacillus niacini TaxID=86668 RepID=UPI002FFE6E56